MFYRSFFYECLVNLYFKKKDFLGRFKVQIYSFLNTYSFLVRFNTKHDLNNLYTIVFLIRFSNKFKIFFKKILKKLIFTSDPKLEKKHFS